MEKKNNREAKREDSGGDKSKRNIKGEEQKEAEEERNEMNEEENNPMRLQSCPLQSSRKRRMGRWSGRRTRGNEKVQRRWVEGGGGEENKRKTKRT